MAVKLKKGSFNRSNALTNLVNRDKLTPHLLKGTMEDFAWEYEYKPKNGDDAWHPSGHCTPSALELYHIATATEEERAKAQEKWLGMHRIFQVGHFWHQYYQQIVQRLGFADERSIERPGTRWWGDPLHTWAKEDIYYGRIEVSRDEAIRFPQDLPRRNVIRPQPYHWACGMADVAPCVIPRAGEFVVDFKTMGNHDFKRAGMPPHYAAKYEAQINIYMDFFDLEAGLIVGIQKDTPHNLKEFQFHRNQPLIDAIYEKWEHVAACIDDGAEPDKTEPELPLKGPVET